VLACAVRLLERGFFRIGSEEYAVQNATYGLATMRKEHVRIEPDGQMEFRYPAKSGIRRVQGVIDEQACAVVRQLKRRRGGGPELLAYKEGGRWHDVRSEDINAYLKEGDGRRLLAKDFRTWNATLLAAVALGVAGEVAATRTGRKARGHARDQGGGRLPRQHARRLPRLLHRSARVRRLPVRVDHRADARARRERGAPGELPIHQPELEAAVLDLLTSARLDGAGRSSVTLRLAARRRRRAAGASTARGDAVHDDRDEHARDHRPHDEVALRRREHAGLDRRSRRCRTASRRRARRTTRRTAFSVRVDPCASARATRATETGRTATSSSTASSHPPQPGVASPLQREHGAEQRG
jgi:hypothetical protein